MLTWDTIFMLISKQWAPGLTYLHFMEFALIRIEFLAFDIEGSYDCQVFIFYSGISKKFERKRK